MKRLTARLCLFGLVGLVGLGASACNLQWSSYAARVQGHQISTGQLDSAMRHASSDVAFRCLLEGSSSTGYRLQGSGSDTYDSAFAAFLLTDFIDAEIAHDAVTGSHLKLPADGMSLARGQVEAALISQASGSGCASGAKDVLSGLGPSLSSSFVRLQLYEDVLAAAAAKVPLTPAGISSFESSHPAITRQSCLTGIFVPTKAEADKLFHQAASGTSFSSLVAHYSKKAGSSGGPLGCYTQAQLEQISPAIASSVAAGKTGEVLKPVFYQGSSGSAYLVTEVTSRRFEPFAAALNQLFSFESRAFAKVVSTESARLNISIDPRYGSWTVGRHQKTAATSGYGGRVVPPQGPPLHLVLNEKAVLGRLHVRINPAGLGTGG